VVEVVAVDAALGAELHAVVELVLARHHGDRHAASGLDDLDGHRAQPARATPDEDDVVLLDGVLAPAVQHAPRCGRDEGVGRGGLPGHVLGLGHALLGLDLGELGEAAPVGLVAPDPEGRGVHRVAAALTDGQVRGPLAAVHDDLVADLDVGDVLADLVDDAGGVAAADVEGLAAEVAAGVPLVAGADDIDRDAEAGPDVVVVDPGRHDVDEHLVVGDVGDVDDLLLEGLHRRAEPLRADQPGVHLLGDLSEGRHLTDVVQLLGHAWRPFCDMPQFPGVAGSRRAGEWSRGRGSFLTLLASSLVGHPELRP
jgi:hypothetical protein